MRGWLPIPLLLCAAAAGAGPWAAPGDMALRHDVQVLADAGVIAAPVTTWPLSWGELAAAARDAGVPASPAAVAALARLRGRLADATRSHEVGLTGRIAAAANPRTIRGFGDGPREEGEIAFGAEWTGDWLALNLNAQWVADADDDREWRADGSYAGLALGNWMLSAGVFDRWWGPGWQGSLVMSNNARPIPGFALERNFAEPFESRWLSWIGPWDLALTWGFLETDRFVPDARIFGMRFNFRPLPSLEIGLSRAAVWCGRGRPCDTDAFIDLLAGRDNVGDNVSAADEPGNQLAGVDLRWSGSFRGRPLAIYTQWIGEDENNFWPTKWLGQLGAETWGEHQLGSYRVFLEWADTECDFRLYRSLRGDDGPDDAAPNCGYNHPRYRSGYRYRGAAIGHGTDGDSSVITLGGVLITEAERQFAATASAGNLNRRRADARHSLAAQKTRYRELEVTHRRPLWLGMLDAGLGYESRRNAVTGNDDEDLRIFAEWTVRY